MHISIYHHALIPPPKYGGTERIVYWLALALKELGHEVTLLAKRGSRIPGVNCIELSDSQAENWEQWIPPSTDLVHLWATPAKPPKKPFLVTIEGNGQFGEEFHSNTVFVSKKHAENHGSSAFVYNGIDPDRYESDPLRADYLVFLAKASWKVKNFEGAAQLTRKLRIPLLVMGSRFPSFLFWRRVKLLGMVGDLKKREILRKARGLLFPVRWHEPFGIALSEALASGCPVYGTPYGSLPEIISPKTGYLSARSDELSKAIVDSTFSPVDCRNRVLAEFTHAHMAQKYLSYYREVLETGSIEENRNRKIMWRLSQPATNLLPWT